MKSSVIATLLAVAVLAAAGPALSQEPQQEVESVWTCPLHRDVTEQQPGACHICERELIPTLVQRAWSCPIHAVVVESAPGQCPICQRDLFLITEEVRFACPMHPAEESHEPGECSICHMALEPFTSARPHQDHNPKHGGMFFMAPDNWHHLEGVYPEDGVFRVFLYNNFSEPMNAKEFKGRAVLREVFDTETKETREVLAYPLLPAPDGGYLEAHVGSAELPREITAKVRFERDGEFERFDFIFANISSARDELDSPSAIDANADDVVIPQAPKAIVAAIVDRSASVRELVAKGALGEIYLPALQAKDLAVALESDARGRPVAERKALTWALKQLVRSAWLLDDYGDLGNREKVNEAHELFVEAVEEIRRLYP